MSRASAALLFLILVIIALHYVLPFTVLRLSRGFELLAFWAATAVAAAVVATLYVEKEVRG